MVDSATQWPHRFHTRGVDDVVTDVVTQIWLHRCGYTDHRCGYTPAESMMAVALRKPVTETSLTRSRCACRR